MCSPRGLLVPINVDCKMESSYFNNRLFLHFLTSKKKKKKTDLGPILNLGSSLNPAPEKWTENKTVLAVASLTLKYCAHRTPGPVSQMHYLICHLFREWYYPEKSHMDTGKSHFHNSTTSSYSLRLQGHMGETNQSVNAWEKSVPISANHLSISAVHMYKGAGAGWIHC